MNGKQSSGDRPQSTITRRSLLGAVGGVATGVPLLLSASGAVSAFAEVAKEAPDKPAAAATPLPSKFSTQPIRVEMSPKWVRVVFGGQVVADSKQVLLVWDRGRTPVYYFPEKDVHMNLLTPTDKRTHSDTKGDASYYTLKVGEKTAENSAWRYAKPDTADHSLGKAPDLKGYVSFEWGKMDGWYEEGEEVFVHPHDPYHRIDTLSSSRHVRVVVGGMTVAETHRPVLLFETGMLTRYYIPKEDVRLELLRPSDTITRCAYKGEAKYYSLAIGDKLFNDVVWYYRYPTTEASKIVNNLAFYNEEVEAIFVDGEEVTKAQKARG